MALLMFNDLGKLEIGENQDQASIQNQQKTHMKRNWRMVLY